MDADAGGRTEGDIRVNGYAQDRHTFTRSSGYVEQADLHSPQTTVSEALWFSSRLRLPPSVPKSDVLAFNQRVGARAVALATHRRRSSPESRSSADRGRCVVAHPIISVAVFVQSVTVFVQGCACRCATAMQSTHVPRGSVLDCCAVRPAAALGCLLARCPQQSLGAVLPHQPRAL